jgi:cytoskeletal protein RodZ
MWPFKRRNNQNRVEVPAEVQEYYQSERRERVGVAWLLALATLIITIVLAAALFLGGRWLYRKVAHRDDNRQPETTQSQNVNESPETGKQSSGSDQNKPGSSTPPPASGSNTQPNVSTGTGSQTPRSTASGSNLPSTGPEDLLAIFVVTALAGTLAHRLVWSRRNT